MKNIFLALIVIVLIPTFFYTQAKAQDKKIAMLEPIPVSEGISGMIKNMVRGELTKSLSREPGFSAFTRVDVDQVMKEFNFQESGMVNDEQRKKLGQMSGADYVCISKISKDENAYYIEASLVDIESGEIKNPGTAFAEGGIKDVNLACQIVAADMVGKKVAVQTKKMTVEPEKTNKTPTPQPVKKVDTNPNNFLVLEVEVDFNTHKFMVSNKCFTSGMTLIEAKRAVSNLNYGGYSNWRLPTRRESEIIIENYHEIENWKPAPAFYWTSSPSSRASDQYVIKNNYGIYVSERRKSDALLVRPVRDFK